MAINEIHCHHKIPLKAPFYGTDRYENLVIVHVDVHRLIHATNPQVISKYLAKLNLSKRQLQKLNKLRILVGNPAIEH